MFSIDPKKEDSLNQPHSQLFPLLVRRLVLGLYVSYVICVMCCNVSRAHIRHVRGFLVTSQSRHVHVAVTSSPDTGTQVL